MRTTYVLAAAALAIGLATAGCTSSSDSGSGTTTTAGTGAQTTSTTAETTTATANAGLQSLIPTPTGTKRTDGPDPVHDGGIHLHFEVNGAPTAVGDAYKAALQGKGWSVTVGHSGGGNGGGGFNYIGTNGDAYGTFGGGGYADTTDIQACVWPTKPANTNCRD